MAKKLAEIEFEKLVYDNQLLIIKVCNIYCHSQHDKDDLFQEITLNIWKGLPLFKGHSNLSTWIYRISINTAISRCNKKKNNKISYAGEVPERGFSIPSYGDEVDVKVKALYEGIDKLKAIEKAIVLLYLEEKSYDEIAEIIGISANNVSVKLVRLKRKLEQIVKSIILKNG